MGQEVTIQNQNMLRVNSDTSKIFVFNNRFSTGESKANSTYDDATWLQGTLLGRVSATGKLVPLVSSAVDGSQYPVGILAEDSIIPAGDSATLTFCVAGDVVEDKVVLNEGDTMDTAISGRTIKDRIGADTVGIKLVGNDELTGFDNE